MTDPLHIDEISLFTKDFSSAYIKSDSRELFFKKEKIAFSSDFDIFYK